MTAKPTRSQPLLRGDIDEQLRASLNGVTNHLNGEYVLGTLDFIKKNHPDLYFQTKDMEDAMQSAWKAIIEGAEDATNFYRLLGEWEGVHRQWIELFAQAKLGGQDED